MKPITFRPTEISQKALAVLMYSTERTKTQAINAALVVAAAKIEEKDIERKLGEDRPSPPPTQAALIQGGTTGTQGLVKDPPSEVLVAQRPRTRVDPAKIDAFQRQMARKK